jgi:hypothetical protein
MRGQRGIILFSSLAYVVGGGSLLVALDGESVRRSTVSIPQGMQADTLALQAEIARLKRNQRVERGVCAVVSGFTLWRFVK